MARPTPSGRSLDVASDGDARGMVVIRCRSYERQRAQNSAYGSLRNFFMNKFLAILFAAALALTAPTAGIVAQQTPGQIRSRPAEGREPQLNPPTIREYKPKSTLVVPQHPVPRAKFPVIDIHSHHLTPMSPAEYEKVVKAMDQLNLQVIVNLSGGWGDRLRQGLAAIKSSPYPERMVLFANVDFRDIGPGFGARAAKQLEEDIKAGAKGLKIFKQLGLWYQKTDRTRLKLDDTELDPIWD